MFLVIAMLIDGRLLEEKLEQEPPKQDVVKNRLNPILALREEQFEWAKYDRKNNAAAVLPRYHTNQSRAEPMPFETRAVNIYELHYGREPEKKARKEAREEYAAETAKQLPPEQTVLDTQQAAQMAERIRYGKWFSTLNDLTAQEKEDWHHYTRSPVNRVWRALADGSYSRMKGYHSLN